MQRPRTGAYRERVREGERAGEKVGDEVYAGWQPCGPIAQTSRESLDHRARVLGSMSRNGPAAGQKRGHGVEGIPTALVGGRDGKDTRGQSDEQALANYGIAGPGRERDSDRRCVALHAVSRFDRVFDQTQEGGTDHIKMQRISSANYLQRPAAKQVREKGPALQRAEGCNELNIWYGKYIGEQWSDRDMMPAEGRCVVRRDAGRTRADDWVGQKGAYCCIFFARGICTNGSDCNFLHRIPNANDELRLSLATDIFGRERHNTNRDDMRGTGNFNSESRTLYVGGLKLLNGPHKTFAILLRHMSEWGEVEQMRLITGKAIAFVRFKLRCSAEFALEAMHCQSLGRFCANAAAAPRKTRAMRKAMCGVDERVRACMCAFACALVHWRGIRGRSQADKHATQSSMSSLMFAGHMTTPTPKFGR